MKLLDRVGARHRDAIRAADPVSLEEFGALLAAGRGGSAESRAGVKVGTQRALGITAWHRGVRYLAETVASLPVHTYRIGAGNARQQRARPLWQTQPDDDITWFGLVEHWMMSMVHRGNAFAFKLRNPAGQVVGLRPIHPDSVKFGLTTSARKVFRIPSTNGEEMPYTTREVFHIPALSTDGYFGIDPIRAFADPLGIIAAADEYAARSFSKGSHLAAYISLPGRLDDEDANRLYSQWEKLHTGVDARRFGVIGDGATYNTIGLDPQQTQLLESRKFGVTEIARMLGVVPHKLYDLERATFSNIEHQAIEAVTDGIRPWVSRIEAWANVDTSLMPTRNFLEFELEGLLRGDTKSRYEAYTAAVGGPWMEGNVPRRLENLPPRPELDTVLRPLNMTPADESAAPQPASVREIAEVAQKIYLAVVNNVITATEARELLKQIGAEIPADFPEEGPT